MTIFIKLYLLLNLSLVAFNIVFLLVNRRKRLTAYKINKSFAKEIRQALSESMNDHGDFPLSFAASLREHLPVTRNMLTLQQVIEADEEARQRFQPYIWEQIDHYAKKRDEYERAYYTYILSTFDYSRSKPADSDIVKLLAFLNSNSLYTFSNTMMALYAIGDIPALLRAVEKTDERPEFYHKKLLVDGLLTAKLEHAEFASQLQKNFAGYTPYTQNCLIDYFRLNGSDAVSLCLSLMRDPKTDSEVRYSAMRYFAKHPDPEAKRLFMEILADEDAAWLEQMLSIQALVKYGDPKVRMAIEKKVTSRNWYVRVNALQFMHRNGLRREDVLNILYLRDRYTSEYLLYLYREDEEMTRYIIDTIHLLNVQAEAVQESGNIEAISAPPQLLKVGDENI
ncbi:MAG: hypothetical protein QM296_00840 [Bacillota bacterium]|nr:hypothetical protein [Bacillota bacterium]